MKGGTKPCYREWTKTQKKREPLEQINTQPQIHSPIFNNTINKSDIVQKIINKRRNGVIHSTHNKNKTNDVFTSIHKIKNTIGNNNNTNDFNTPKIKKRKKIIKRVIKKTYTVGKSKVNNRVSVFLKNNQTQKIILNHKHKFKTTPKNDIKKYLREHNLIKIGSLIPDDVLHEMYSNVKLAGDIYNTNTNTRLFNYVNNEES